MPNENTQPTSFEDLQNQIQLCMILSRRISGPQLQKFFAGTIVLVTLFIPQEIYFRHAQP